MSRWSLVRSVGWVALVGAALVGFRVGSHSVSAVALGPSDEQAEPDLREAVEPHVLRITTPDPDGSPIEGAQVTVEYFDDWIDTLQTDADGQVELGAHVRSLQVLAPGRVPGRWNHSGLVFVDEETGRVVPVGTPPQHMTLGPGVELRGRVIDARTRAPIEGAEVVANAWGWWGDRGFHARATTAAVGRFVLPGSPPSRGSDWGGRRSVELEVSRLGYVTASREPRLDPVPTSATPAVFALDPDSPVRGVLLDAEGRPVEGVIVAARSRRGTVESAVTDAEGRFTLRGLREGARLALTARSDSRREAEPVVVTTPHASEVVLRFPHSVPPRRFEVPVRVIGPGGDDLDDCEVHVGYEPRYSRGDGRQGDSPLVIAVAETDPQRLWVSAAGMAPVFSELESLPGPGEFHVVALVPSRSVEGVVVSDRGRPVFEASVTIGPVQPNDAFIRRSARTAIDGTFRIDDLGPGELVAWVESYGHQSALHPITSTDDRQTVTLPRNGRVRVDMVPPDERAFGHPYSVYPLDGAPEPPSPPWEVHSRHPYPHGPGRVFDSTFYADGLPAGRYTIGVRSTAFREVRVPVVVQPGEQTEAGPVRLEPRHPLPDPDFAGRVFVAQVIDSAGRPVPMAEVRARGDGIRAGVCDADGRVEVRAERVGTFTLRAESPGLIGRAELTTDAEERTVVIRVHRTRPVRLRVRDADGDPLHSGGYRGTHEASGIGHGYSLDAAGTADLELLPGRHTVVVRDADDHEFAPVTILVEPIPDGEDAGADITIQVR